MSCRCSTPAATAQAPALIDWLEHNGASLFLSVLTIAEMDAGILKLRRQSKTERADQLASLVTSILTEFGDRVLAVDTETARHVARLGEMTHRQPVALADLIIAATAVRHGLVLLTSQHGRAWPPRHRGARSARRTATRWLSAGRITRPRTSPFDGRGAAYPRNGSFRASVKPLSIKSTPSAPRPPLRPSSHKLPTIRCTDASTMAICRSAWLQSK